MVGQDATGQAGKGDISGFVEPDWSLPLDTEERLRKVPDTTVKGVFFQSTAKAVEMRCGSRDFSPGPYYPFNDYPLRALIELVDEAAAFAFEGVGQREAVRQLGALGYRALRDSVAGKVIFGFVGRSFESAVKVVPKMYNIVSGVTVTLVAQEEHSATISLRDVWVYPDAYHVAVYEEALRAFGKRGRVLIRSHGLADIDIRVEWE